MLMFNNLHAKFLKFLASMSCSRTSLLVSDGAGVGTWPLWLVITCSHHLRLCSQRVRFVSQACLSRKLASTHIPTALLQICYSFLILRLTHWPLSSALLILSLWSLGSNIQAEQRKARETRSLGLCDTKQNLQVGPLLSFMLCFLFYQIHWDCF